MTHCLVNWQSSKVKTNKVCNFWGYGITHVYHPYLLLSVCARYTNISWKNVGHIVTTDIWSRHTFSFGLHADDCLEREKINSSLKEVSAYFIIVDLEWIDHRQIFCWVKTHSSQRFSVKNAMLSCFDTGINLAQSLYTGFLAWWPWA